MNRGRGSKICGGPLWMMVNTFFIGEELREKMYLFAAPLRENDMVTLMETQGKCFEFFCQNPSKWQPSLNETSESKKTNARKEIEKKTKH